MALMLVTLVGCKPKTQQEREQTEMLAALVEPPAGDEVPPVEGPEDLMTAALQTMDVLPTGTKITGCVQVTSEVFPRVDAAPWRCEMEVETVSSPYGDGAALSGKKIVDALDALLGPGKYASPKLWGITEGAAGPKTSGAIGVTGDGSGYYDNYVGKTAGGTYVIFVFVQPGS
jgi:hypothetical protein